MLGWKCWVVVLGPGHVMTSCPDVILIALKIRLKDDEHSMVLMQSKTIIKIKIFYVYFME